MRYAISLVLALCLAGSITFAGGPLYIQDPATGTPYAWPGGRAMVYTDLGALGILSNGEADAMTAFSWEQWNQVPTATFQATMAGDFASIGLPDIDASNIFDVLGPWNGGGIHVVYDADGSIIESLFGYAYGVLGFTIIEYVDDDGPAILEATVVLNGLAVPEWLPPAEAAAAFAGIGTHEFGHALNLAHSQTNGQLVFGFDVNPLTYEPNTGAAGCPAPYTGGPDVSQIETMYPFASVEYSGPAQSTVDVLDDVAAISDLYPVAGWPAARPAIAGTVYWPDGTSQYTGANVIARNIADPWVDAISALSGDFSQGAAGPDGRYAFHGLTPGARYAVYLDGILAGAFSTPIRTVLPGPEEYWNTTESNNGLTDPRCTVTPIAGATGAPRLANLKFNQIPGAPLFTPIELPNSSTTGLSADGGVAVGVSGYGVWRWTPTTGVQMIGGAPWSIKPDVSENGRNIVAEAFREDGLEVAGLWQGGQQWLELGGLPGSTPCGDGNWSSAWGVSNNKKVVGLGWNGCADVNGFAWESRAGMKSLGRLGNGARANDVSADGAQVVGWDSDPNTGYWRGTRWANGRETLFQQPPALCCNPDDPYCPGLFSDVGSANAVNSNGSVVVGEGYQVERLYVDPDTGDEYHYCSPEAWRWTAAGGTQRLGDFYGAQTIANDSSDDGNVVVGLAWPADFFAPPQAWLWTPATGVVDYVSFLNAQGTYAQDWLIAGVNQISADAKTAGGFAATPFSYQGWIVRMPKVVVCHKQKTIAVDFPASLPDHMAHGDTIGVCGNGIY